MEINPRLDPWLERRFAGLRQDPVLRAGIDAVKAKAASGQATSADVLNLAWREAAASYAKQGQVVGSEAIRGRALAMATAATLEAPYQLSDLPKGTDKSKHFMVSAWAAQKFTAAADRFLPRFAAEWFGLGLTKAAGVLKEIVDKLTGGDMSREDIVADFQGARWGVRLGREGQ